MSTGEAVANPYETDALLAQYLLLHYGSAEETFGSLPGPVEAVGFPKRCVTELLAPGSSGERALDVGCAVGGSCFELAASHKEVLGIDYSRGFVGASQTISNEGFLEVALPEEGFRKRLFVARAPAHIDRSGLSFAVGDAMNLDPGLESFDTLLAANLICRLREPLKFIHRLPGLVRPGGQLLLTTPFTWLEDYTPRENWLGSAEMTSFDALTQLLERDFSLDLRCEVPFVIREHARKFQYGIATGSRWIRKH